MGGENYGEVASYVAASEMRKALFSFAKLFTSAEKYLARLTSKLNKAVVGVQNELETDRMGTTLAMLSFTPRCVHVCNIGDSREYLFREGELKQISVDHVDSRPQKENRKAPLTQHLGIDPQYLRIRPHIEEYRLKHGDVYLLCSDGISDMLTDREISALLRQSSESSEICVNRLIAEALANGGRDNITAIVCRII